MVCTRTFQHLFFFLSLFPPRRYWFRFGTYQNLNCPKWLCERFTAGPHQMARKSCLPGPFTPPSTSCTHLLFHWLSAELSPDGVSVQLREVIMFTIQSLWDPAATTELPNQDHWHQPANSRRRLECMGSSPHLNSLKSLFQNPHILYLRLHKARFRSELLDADSRQTWAGGTPGGEDVLWLGKSLLIRVIWKTNNLYFGLLLT